MAYCGICHLISLTYKYVRQLPLKGKPRCGGEFGVNSLSQLRCQLPQRWRLWGISSHSKVPTVLPDRRKTCPYEVSPHQSYSTQENSVVFFRPLKGKPRCGGEFGVDSLSQLRCRLPQRGSPWAQLTQLCT